MNRSRTLLGAVLTAIALALSIGPGSAGGSIAAADLSAYVPPARHGFVVNIENSGYDETWGPSSKAPYLARTHAARACS